jgi:hypothetical protein
VRSTVQKAKAAIVVAASYAKPNTAIVERYEWREHEVESTSIDACTELGLVYTEEIPCEPCVRREFGEVHAAAGDDGCIEAFTGCMSNREQRFERRFTVEREIDGDVLRTAELPRRSQMAQERLVCGLPRQRRECSAGGAKAPS